MKIISKKLTHAVLITVLLLLLNGCGEPQEPAVNQINHLAQNSQEIDKALASLSNHEQEDMKLYRAILSQGKEKNSPITGFLDQVETHIEARRTILEQIEEAWTGIQEKLFGGGGMGKSPYIHMYKIRVLCKSNSN